MYLAGKDFGLSTTIEGIDTATAVDDEVHDPWSMHVARFRVIEAQLTALPENDGLISHHGMTLLVEEGREEVRRDLENADSTAAALDFFVASPLPARPHPIDGRGRTPRL